jgi:hypothetical protein
MARISHDARAAAFFRAGSAPPDPPKVLSTRAKSIWREIVGAKPVDWFDGGNFGYLADHCEEQARLEQIWVALRQVVPGTNESRNLTAELKTVRGNLATSARHLRLTVQETVADTAAKTKERQTTLDNELVSPGARLKKVA